MYVEITAYLFLVLNPEQSDYTQAGDKRNDKEEQILNVSTLLSLLKAYSVLLEAADANIDVLYVLDLLKPELDAGVQG